MNSELAKFQVRVTTLCIWAWPNVVDKPQKSIMVIPPAHIRDLTILLNSLMRTSIFGASCSREVLKLLDSN